MTLKNAYKEHFYIGAAFGGHVLSGEALAPRALIERQFSSITPENDMKWSSFNPKPGVYNYDPVDRFVEFGKKNNMYVVGHVLFWHNQTPEWVFKDDAGNPLSRDALLARMRERVRHVANRYKGRIHAWDVVNEAIEDNGKLRDSQWTRIIGADFIEQAFRIADEELPKDVVLIYNDYSMTATGRRDAIVKMVNDFKQKGVRINAVGMQEHLSIDGPSINEIEKSILAFSGSGVDVHITELDVDVLPRSPQMWSGNADVKLQLEQDPKLDPYREGLPEDMQQKLASRYADLFRLYIKHRDKIKRVTFWGVTDKHTWLNSWPIKGRTSHPLLFDREGKPKPAYQAVMDLVERQCGLVDQGKDLLSLHYDHAPDKDDGHSAAADRTILQSLFGREWVARHVIAVSGVYGTNAKMFNPASDAVMDAAWNECGGWLGAHTNRAGVVAQLQRRWLDTLQSGGDVWIKEGGQSDITAEVVRNLREADPAMETVKRIHVVQHSDWNERHTTPAALAYTRTHTHYIRIRDANAYLNIKGGDGTFEKAALAHPVFGPVWKAAFAYYSPRERLDFSDTGELMHMLELGEVGMPEFRKRYLDIPENNR